MIKNSEVAMVNAATFALDYQDKKYNAEVEEIIKKFMDEPGYFNMKGELKLYAIAAINEIIKMKGDKSNKNKTNKQLVQSFTKMIPQILNRIDEEG